MEMPEGFNRLAQQMKDENWLNLDMFRAMDLVKEMAEALEFYAAKSSEHPNFWEMHPNGDWTISVIRDSGATARHIVQKFKEWK